MADNTTLNQNTTVGDTIALDELTTLNGLVAAPVGIKAQRVKIGFGDDGDFRDASSAFPLPVAGPLTDTQLRATALPLPTGASTGALQTTGNTSVASIDTKTPALGQALAAASAPVVLTAIQVTTLTPPAAITGFALESTLALIKAKTDNIDVALSTRAVTGLTDAQLRANVVPVILQKTSVSTAPAQTAVGIAAAEILAALATRKRFVVVNTGTTVIKLAFSVSPTQTAYHVVLGPASAADNGTGGSYVDEDWIGSIHAISSAAGGTIVITELT